MNYRSPFGALQANPDVRIVLETDNHVHLSRMSLLSGIAIFIHNLPEGMATFVGAMADYRAGIAICVAIALHNIPEVRACGAGSMHTCHFGVLHTKFETQTGSWVEDEPALHAATSGVGLGREIALPSGVP